MRILHINDIHVPKKGENTYGVDVIDNVTRIIKKVKSLSADLLVINGDLGYLKGDEATYQWIKAQLEDLPYPLAITSGNHDVPSILAKVFDMQDKLINEELFYHLQLEEQDLIFLDTTTGKVSDQQLEWLEKKLEEIPYEFFLFMHHPPIRVGVPFMDNKHALKNMGAIQEILLNHSGNVYAFSGHYHVEKMVQLENLQLFVTPSCFFQIDQFEEQFKPDHYRIAFRDISWVDGVLRTAVHYLDGAMIEKSEAMV